MNSLVIQEFQKLIKQKEMDFLKAGKQEQLNKNFSLMQTRKALKIISSFEIEIKGEKELKKLAELSGIGKKTILRIREILEKGKLSEIKGVHATKEHLKKVQELQTIIGIGPKKAEKLVTEHNIDSIRELVSAHRKGKITLDDKILLGLKYHKKYHKTIPRKEIFKVDQFLHQVAKEIDLELFLVICGSYRRGKATSNDIDVLITHPKIKTKKDLETKTNYLHLLVVRLRDQGFLLDDLTDKDFENKYMGFGKYSKLPIRRIDIRYVPFSSYYSALLYFTGSGEFNRNMREHAINLGYKLSEYGLFKRKKDGKFSRVKITSEQQLFTKLGLEYVLPEEREVS